MPVSITYTKHASQALPLPPPSTLAYTHSTYTAHFTLDSLPSNEPGVTPIVDLDLLTFPVKWEMDLTITHPTSPTDSSGLAILGIPNRTRPSLGNLNLDFNPSMIPRTSPLPSLGDANIHSKGHIVITPGWQGDLTTNWELEGGMVAARYPILEGVTGWTEVWFVLDMLMPGMTPPVPDTLKALEGYIGSVWLPYPLASTAKDVEDKEEVIVEIIPPKGVNTEDIDLKMDFKVTSARSIVILKPRSRRGKDELSTFIDPGTRYRVRYKAKNPRVEGLSHLGLLELSKSLKNQTPTNPSPLPSAFQIQKLVTQGESQCGRLQRSLLFNGYAPSDVFDGHFLCIAGGKMGSFNIRWAMPGSTAFGWEDPVVVGGVRGEDMDGENVGRSYAGEGVGGGSISSTKVAPPKIFHIDTASEFYQAGSSLISTELDPVKNAVKDSPTPDNVRLYFLSSTAHIPYPAQAPDLPFTTFRPNDISTCWIYRGLWEKFEKWVMEDQNPGESCWPTVEKGELLDPTTEDPQKWLGWMGRKAKQTWRFNPMPWVGENTPPTPLNKVLLPKMDVDGNDEPGIKLPVIAVPTATRTGWNPRPAGYDGGASLMLPGKGGSTQRFFGTLSPFELTRSGREESEDVRLSLGERYGAGEVGSAMVNQRRGVWAEELVAKGFLKKEDLEAVLKASLS